MRIALSGIALLLSGLAQAGPVEFVQRGTVGQESIEKVLLNAGPYLITRAVGATDAEFKDLYWLNLEDSRYDRFTLEQFGRVELYVAEAFAVVSIAPDDLLTSAEILHEDRWACGQLIRLFGDEVPAQLALNKAVPIIPLTEKVVVLNSLHAEVSTDAIRATVEAMVALGTRYSKSSRAADVTEYLLARYKEIAGDRSDVTFEKIAHAGYNQPSLIVRILGQKRPGEIIVLGSHIDSIARGSELAPGADDNASGTASQMEVFRTIINRGLSFDRTVEIHGYAAEELGLIGSQEIAKRYVSNGKKVIAMVQNDMNMYKATPEDQIWLITNDSDPQLTLDMEQLLRSYQTVVFNKNKLTAGTSDHRSWNRQGIPVAFPTENPNNFNRKIHTADDVIAQSGAFTQSAEFVKLSLSFLAHFAGLVASN